MSPPGPRQRRGRGGEAVVAQALAARGFRVVVQNYRCRYGEVDLIARQGPLLVFVEVKTRRYHRYGTGLAAVDGRKQHRMIRTAQHYLAHATPGDVGVRFDVVEVLDGPDGPQVHSWVEGAFEVPA